MNKPKLHWLKLGLVDFYRFAPKKLLTILGLMLVQRATAGIGLLMILPLLQLLGFETLQTSAISEALKNGFSSLGLALNLGNILGLFLLLIFFVASLQYFLTTLSTELKQNYTHQMRLTLYQLILHTQWAFISQRKVAEFNHVLTIQVQSISHAAHLILTSIAALSTLIVMLVLALLLSWQMTLLAIATALVLMASLWPLYRKSYHSGATQLTSYKAIFHQLSEQLASLKMVKSHAKESIYFKNIDQISQQLEQQNLLLTQMNAKTKWVYTLGAAAAFSLLLWLSQTWLAIAFPTLLVLLVLYSRILPQVSQLQTNLQQLIHKIPAYADFFSMRQACQQAQEAQSQEQAVPFSHSITLNNIAFQYPNAKTPTLQNIHLTLNKGEIMIISGESGAGKSTLVDIIVGLLPPTEGTLLLDQQTLTPPQMQTWRKQIAYVTQEVYLFHDSVRGNLTSFLTDTPTDEAIWQALTLAAADQFVKALPQGLETLIGDRGIKLSGGERQRLALARALLMQPKLLILDEATSALDQENELRIQQAIAQLHGKQTMIIISHRPNAEFKADKVINLHKQAIFHVPISWSGKANEFSSTGSAFIDCTYYPKPRDL